MPHFYSGPKRIQAQEIGLPYDQTSKYSGYQF